MDVATMPTQKRLAMKIERLRAARGMTQEGLPKKSGLTRVHLARLEAGNHDPTLGTLQKLAKALKVKVGALVEWQKRTEKWTAKRRSSSCSFHTRPIGAFSTL